MRITSAIALSLLSCLAAILAACGTPAQGLIVGTWDVQNVPTRMTAEFHRDGTADLIMLGQTLHGTYKLDSNNELEWSMNGQSTRQKVNVTAETLEITDSDNQTVIYRRR